MDTANEFDNLFEQIILKLNEKNIDISLLTQFSYIVVRYFKLEYYETNKKYSEDEIAEIVCEIANASLAHNKFLILSIALSTDEIELIVAMVAEKIFEIIK